MSATFMTSPGQATGAANGGTPGVTPGTNAAGAQTNTSNTGVNTSENANNFSGDFDGMVQVVTAASQRPLPASISNDPAITTDPTGQQTVAAGGDASTSVAPAPAGSRTITTLEDMVAAATPSASEPSTSQRATSSTQAVEQQSQVPAQPAPLSQTQAVAAAANAPARTGANTSSVPVEAATTAGSGENAAQTASAATTPETGVAAAPTTARNQESGSPAAQAQPNTNAMVDPAGRAAASASDVVVDEVQLAELISNARTISKPEAPSNQIDVAALANGQAPADPSSQNIATAVSAAASNPRAQTPPGSVTPGQAPTAPVVQDPASPAPASTGSQAPVQASTPTAPTAPIAPAITSPAPDAAQSHNTAPQSAASATPESAPGSSALTGSSDSAEAIRANEFANLVKTEPQATAPLSKAAKAAPAQSNTAPSSQPAGQSAQPNTAPPAMQQPAPVDSNQAAALNSSAMAQTPGAQLAQRVERNQANASGATGSSGVTASSTSSGTQATAQSSPAASNTTAATGTSPTGTPPELRLGEPAPQPLPPLTTQPQDSAASMFSDPSVSLDPELSVARAPGQTGAERAGNELARFTPHSAQNLAGQIAKRFNNGNRVFEIRLDPAELGRVDVRLEMSGDNRVQAYLSVERADTLAELQRAARDLERALNDAGLELDENGLSFELSDNADQSGFDEDASDALPVYETGDFLDFDDSTAAQTDAPTAYGFRLAGARDRVDVLI
ncbi:MAG: hypothetical protein GYB36_02585 [Alphaproteobacteria bacterium]|nr:hypothetical protein [Alphaproteobacteria bacterium]